MSKQAAAAYAAAARLAAIEATAAAEAVRERDEEIGDAEAAAAEEGEESDGQEDYDGRGWPGSAGSRSTGGAPDMPSLWPIQIPEEDEVDDDMDLLRYGGMCGAESGDETGF